MSFPARLLALLALVGCLLAPTAAATSATATTAEPHRTRVVVRVANCEGCEVFLQQGLRERWWSSRVHRVRDGRAVFDVWSGHTRGLSIGITGTWEAASPHPSGFQSIVTLRYRGVAAGERVSRTVAASKHHGSACFPGTTADRLVFHVEARKVRIPGNGGPALSTLAWASPQTRTMAGTQASLFHGIQGAQDIVPCF